MRLTSAVVMQADPIDPYFVPEEIMITGFIPNQFRYFLGIPSALPLVRPRTRIFRNGKGFSGPRMRRDARIKHGATITNRW